MNQKIPEIDEQIAQLIASLPSEHLLQQAKTPAQIEEWHKVGFSWIGMVLWTCQMEAKNDPLLRKQLVAYNKSLWEALSLGVSASGNLHGWAWHKGELLCTDKAGGIYRKA